MVGLEKTHPDAEDRTQVLVIDRDRELVELIALVLRSAGLDFIAVHDVASALETFVSRWPRVVVVDPNGLDVLKQLQASSVDTAFIVLTAGESDDPTSVALGLSVSGYLTKPFSGIELVGAIRACLRSRRVFSDLPQERIQASSRVFAQ